MREVDGPRGVGEDLHAPPGVVVAGFEGVERAGGAAAEAELGGELGPVELVGGAGLWWVRIDALVRGEDDERVGVGSWELWST